MLQIKPILSLPNDLTTLIQHSEREGFNFIRRLKEDWDNGSNRFNGSGEFLLAASDNQTLLGVCGVNIDPYVQSNSQQKPVARLRHLYVIPSSRSKQLGSQLVNACLAKMHADFTAVRLRVPDAATGAFYEKLGFDPIEDTTATHSLNLN